MVPLPCLWVDWLTYSTQNPQTGEVIAVGDKWEHLYFQWADFLLPSGFFLVTLSWVEGVRGNLKMLKKCMFACSHHYSCTSTPSAHCWGVCYIRCDNGEGGLWNWKGKLSIWKLAKWHSDQAELWFKNHTPVLASGNSRLFWVAVTFRGWRLLLLQWLSSVLHQQADGCWSCIELGHFILLNNLPEAADMRVNWNTFKLEKKHVCVSV